MAPRGPGLLLAVLLTAVIGILGMGRASATPPPFDPGGVMCFESLESRAECDGDTAPGAATDIRLRFCTGWNDDCTVRDTVADASSFASVVAFTPTSWGLNKGDTIPIGAVVGRMDEQTTVSLWSGPCNLLYEASWTLLNASIDANDTISPKAQGLWNIMEPLAIDANGNGIPDGADRFPSFLNEYSATGDPLQPKARLFAVTNSRGSEWVTQNIVFLEPGSTIKVAQTQVTFDPRLGYPALVVLQDPAFGDVASDVTTTFCSPASFDLVVLGKTLDNPCTPVSSEGANCPVYMVNQPPEFRTLRYPLLACDTRGFFDDDGDGVINDGCPQAGNKAETGAECDNAVSDDLEDHDINDGCPIVGDVGEGSRIPGACGGGDEGGCTYRANPASVSSANFTVLGVSRRDADGDGIENGLDVCALIPNSEWNPRADDPANDLDSDGLPDVCDPDPTIASAYSPSWCGLGQVGPSDEDQDCYANQADNCPLANQLDNPAEPPGLANLPLQTDSDVDGIGDACDPHPNAVDGENIGYCLKFPLEVGGTGGPMVGVRDPTLWPGCVAGTSCPVVPCVGGGNGNVDCDGNVDAVDALYVLRSVAGLPVAAECLAEGDVDCGLGLSATDALVILLYVARLIGGLPVGCI